MPWGSHAPRCTPSAAPIHDITPDYVKFEVDFPGAYNAILGSPGYVKFMVVSNYTYLKLKMPDPMGSLWRPLPSKQPMRVSKLAASSRQDKPL
jgi:hypothetical protein